MKSNFVSCGHFLQICCGFRIFSHIMHIMQVVKAYSKRKALYSSTPVIYLILRSVYHADPTRIPQIAEALSKI